MHTDELDERFWSKVDKSGECWMWTAGETGSGYGQFHVKRKPIGAHVWSYLRFVGPIPDGFDVDHLCHTPESGCAGGVECPHRRCVRPEHLEAVSRSENLRRGNLTVPRGETQRAKTHCPKGHQYDAENTRVLGDGKGRACKRCHRDRERKRRSESPRESTRRPDPLEDGYSTYTPLDFTHEM